MGEKTFSKSPCYIAYLLRFWNDLPANRQTGLRMMLIDLRTGKQWSFSDLEQLVAFLEQKVPTDDHQAEDV